MATLQQVAPAFRDMAHRIVWATVAADGRPRTRMLHPLWEWGGTELVGWILASPLSPKRADPDTLPKVSLTYWVPEQVTCTAEADVTWVLDDAGRRRRPHRCRQPHPPVQKVEPPQARPLAPRPPPRRHHHLDRQAVRLHHPHRPTHHPTSLDPDKPGSDPPRSTQDTTPGGPRGDHDPPEPRGA